MKYSLEVRGRFMAKDRTIQPGFHNAINIMVTNVNTKWEVIAIGSESHDNLIKYI
jgi:hypothetical protein